MNATHQIWNEMGNWSDIRKRTTNYKIGNLASFVEMLSIFYTMKK